MLLCIDVGNTNITFAVYDKDNLIKNARLETYDKMLDDFLREITANIDYVMVASVVPVVSAKIKEKLTKLDINYSFVDSVSLGLDIDLDDPRELGSDIVVGAYQAIKKYGYPSIVIDMGTAITMVVIDKNKCLLGGIIYPGFRSMYKVLFKDTALLKEVDIASVDHVIGKNTTDCIRSGMIFGTVSLLDGMIEDMIKEASLGCDTKIILTGGFSSLIYKKVKMGIYDKDLLTDGLKNIYEDIIEKEVKIWF